jgi:hypothetical protein
MERERACAAWGSRSRYYYYSTLTTNIECNKKKRAEFDFDTREECESRPWRAFYLHTHTHISSLEKRSWAHWNFIIHTRYIGAIVSPGQICVLQRRSTTYSREKEEKKMKYVWKKNLDPVGHDQPAYSVYIVVVAAHSFHSSLAHFLDRNFFHYREEEEEAGRILLQGLYL